MKDPLVLSDIPTDKNSEAYQELREQLFFIGKEKVNNAPQLFINFDVEADGVPGYGSLLSIGAVNMHGENFYLEVAPQTELYVPDQQKFCEGHGLKRERLMKEGVTAGLAIREFMSWTADQAEHYNMEPVATAFNAWFDFGFLELLCQREGVTNIFGNSAFDLKSYAPAISDSMDWKLTAKQNLPEIILPEGDFEHHALKDAIYQREIQYGLTGLVTALHHPERIKR